MSIPDVIPYIKNAKVGDAVWRFSGNDWNGGNGRGAWHKDTITKIARVYMTLASGRQFEIGTGRARCVNGYTPPDYACGYMDKWLRTERYNVDRAVTSCRDAEKLIAIAKIVGIETPEDGA